MPESMTLADAIKEIERLDALVVKMAEENDAALTKIAHQAKELKSLRKKESERSIAVLGFATSIRVLQDDYERLMKFTKYERSIRVSEHDYNGALYSSNTTGFYPDPKDCEYNQDQHDRR